MPDVRFHLLFALILLSAAALRLSFLAGAVFYDDYHYLQRAVDLALGAGGPPQDIFATRIGLVGPPAVLFRTFGVSPLTATAFPLLCSLGSVAGAYFFGSHLLDRRTGLVAAALLAVCPLDVIFAGELFATTPLTLFVGVSLGCFLLAEEQSSAAYYLASGLSLGLGAVVHETALLALMFYPAYVALVARPARRQRIFVAGLLVWISLRVLRPWRRAAIRAAASVLSSWKSTGTAARLCRAHRGRTMRATIRTAVVAALAATGFVGCGGGGGGGAAPVPFSNPPEIVSQGGVLAGTLTIEPAQVAVAGQDVVFPALYNGLYMPPVLRVQPGDVVRLRLRNFALLPTNVHYHGLNVSPMGAADNVFLDIEPGTIFQYDMPIPADHPQGLFWYHPHFHPLVNTEIAGGLSGGIIVGDILAPFPELAGIPERVMLLKDLKTEDGQPVPDPDPSGPTKRTINGLFQPRLEMQPDQLEFWRIGNIGANIYYQLDFAGQLFYIIAQDGNLQNQAVQTDTLLLPPGKRLEVLVYGPARPGTYVLRAAAFDTGPAGDSYPAQRLASVRSSGEAVPPIPIPSTFPAVPDLRNRLIDRARTIVFADTANPNQFVIDGKPYNHDCVDTVVILGEVEQWTIQNTATEAHVFHIHQLDFQVTAIDGVEQPFTGYQDTVNLPAAADEDHPSSVTTIIPFDDPVIVGEFVYHCHIVQHADQGMMANILVVDPAAPPPVIQRCDEPHGSHDHGE